VARPTPTPEPAEPGGSEAAVEAVDPPRQRWRLTLSREADAPPLGGRESADAWEAALDATGLPLARAGRGRARIAFAAPLAIGLVAERELADILLTERLPVWHVREALEPRLPDGWRLVGLEDCWLGAPALASVVAAADYRVELEGSGADSAAVASAAASLMAAPRLERERQKGAGTVRYDLRPLLIDVRVAETGPPLAVRVRTRLHPTLGAGRPEEVVAALAEACGAPLATGSVVRERVLLSDEVH
jgi:radical SAM-linked protein